MVTIIDSAGGGFCSMTKCRGKGGGAFFGSAFAVFVAAFSRRSPDGGCDLSVEDDAVTSAPSPSAPPASGNLVAPPSQRILLFFYVCVLVCV